MLFKSLALLNQSCYSSTAHRTNAAAQRNCCLGKGHKGALQLSNSIINYSILKIRSTVQKKKGTCTMRDIPFQNPPVYCIGWKLMKQGLWSELLFKGGHVITRVFLWNHLRAQTRHADAACQAEINCFITAQTFLREKGWRATVFWKNAWAEKQTPRPCILAFPVGHRTGWQPSVACEITLASDRCNLSLAS